MADVGGEAVGVDRAGKTAGAVSPSTRSAPTIVQVSQRPNGAASTDRCPRQLRAYGRIESVVTPLSSRNTNRLGSRAGAPTSGGGQVHLMVGQHSAAPRGRPPYYVQPDNALAITTPGQPGRTLSPVF